jgi:hypothetical protein
MGSLTLEEDINMTQKTVIHNNLKWLVTFWLDEKITLRCESIGKTADWDEVSATWMHNEELLHTEDIELYSKVVTMAEMQNTCGHTNDDKACPWCGIEYHFCTKCSAVYEVEYSHAAPLC